MSDFERRLLGQLVTPDAIATVWEKGLRTLVFEEPICAAIYGFITDYWNAEQRRLAPTPEVMASQYPGVVLPTDQDLSLHWLTDQIQNSFRANELQQLLLEVSSLTVTDPDGALKLLRDRSHAAAEAVSPRHSRMVLGEDIEARRRRYYERTMEDGQARGAPLGFDELDEHTNGLLPGELCVVGAFSKTGKTWHLAKVIVEARRKGYNPILFSLEMTNEEIADRVDAAASGLSYDRLSHSKLNPDELAHLHRCQEEFADLGPVRVESPEEGERTVQALANRARHAGSDYLIIDQLSFMEPGKKVQSLKEHHSTIMKQLKTEIGRGSAGRLPCLLAVQANRESTRREGGMGLDSFANATEIEATCDLALGLWRNEEMERNSTMLMEILGARRGKKRKFLLYWELVKTTSMSVIPNGLPGSPGP